MRNVTIFLIALFTVSFVVLVGEFGKMKNNNQPDFQGYSRTHVDVLEEIGK